MKQVIVPSFCVDHTTLDAGLYLRETRRLNLFTTIKVWDLRFSAPRDKQYLTQGGLHTIEHIMAYKLRYLLGDKYISFFPYGCTTGFGFISKSSLTEQELREALIEVIDHTIPLVDQTEIPSLTEKECGRPTMFNMNNANQWLAQYKAVLFK